MIADPEPDEQIQGARDDAHCLSLRQGADRLDDLAQVHAGPGGHRQVDDDGKAKRSPVDVHPVAADGAAALQPGKPVSDRGRRHLDLPGQGSLGLARVRGERAQQGQVEVVHFDPGRGRRGDFRQLGERC